MTAQEFDTYATNRLLAGNGWRAQQFKQLSAPEQTARLQQRFDQLDHGHKSYLDRNDRGSS